MENNSKSRKKKMDYPLILLFLAIATAIIVYLSTKESKRTNSKRHDEVLTKQDSTRLDVQRLGDSVNGEVVELKEQSSKETKDIIEENSRVAEEIKQQISDIRIKELILLTPSEISMPAASQREVQIVMTNNRSYPVFTVPIQLEVAEGNIDLYADCEFVGPNQRPLELVGANTKHRTVTISQLDAKETYKGIFKVNAYNQSKPSKIKLSVPHYMKSPPLDFTIKSDTLPNTINIGPVGDMEVYKNE